MNVLLTDRKTIAEGTTEITLDLRGQEFNFKAGQYVNICLPSLEHPDSKGNCREFSIASSPREAGIIRIAFRNSESGFKRTLLGMPLGREVELDGPFGLFTIPKRQIAPMVFVAGGIGITPFMSMAKTATEDKNSLKIILITSNHSIERTAYREALHKLEKENQNFTLKENLGHLTREFIQETMTEVPEAVYYLAGPPKMVYDIRQALKTAGVDDDDILAEEFVGYE
jgi:ferredoxin-NADP reductase